MSKWIRDRIFSVMLFFLLMISSSIYGQDHNIVLQELMKETQQISNEDRKLRIVWWLPNTFWELSYQNNPSINQEQLEYFLDVFRPYIIVAVVHGDITPIGSINFSADTLIRSNAYITISTDSLYPIPTDSLMPNTKNIISIMTPILKNLLGSMGDNMRFLLFHGLDDKGKPIVNEKQRGEFTVSLFEESFTFRLPLGSILPPVYCPSCMEVFKGNYHYCPWDGTQLMKSGE